MIDVNRIKDAVVDIRDFPKEGIGFKDISPVLADKRLFHATVVKMAAHNHTDCYVALDARGFVFASAMAMKTESGLIMCRKKGKLPGECVEEAYDLEYGSAILEIRKGLLAEGSHVIIVDDILATGGTVLCAAHLCQKAGFVVDEIVVMIELEFLGGRELIENEGFKVRSIITY